MARLRDGGAGHVAGLRLGDTIEPLDGRPATDFTLLQIRRLFTKPGTHKLRVKRGNDSLDIVLVLSEPKEPAATKSGNQRGQGKSSVGVPKRTGSRPSGRVEIPS